MTAQPSSDVNGSQSDPVHHPKHYNSHPSGIECVEYSELLPGNLSHACVYVWRYADKEKPAQDLEKALWFIDREASRTPSEQRSARWLLGLTGGESWSIAEPDGVRIADRFRPLQRFVKEKEFVATVVYRLLRYELAEARTLITAHLKSLREKEVSR